MKLSDIMSSPVVTCGPDDTLRVVSDIFKRTQFHHILVTEQNVLTGVVSDRDFLKAISPNVGKASATPADRATLNKRVSQVMSHSPISLTTQAKLIDVVTLFNQHRISCVPIIDEQRAPVGIITWRDVMRIMLEKYQLKQKPTS
ncbi:CBS domain-containing protein [Pseudoalteromonas sp. SSDWG2]|uniref:CBS domain-containing protein n=1 Tax=Pseudoalteromonas sp. SSDWG2 TaxID=3139391 RepID=UPI003BAD9155